MRRFRLMIGGLLMGAVVGALAVWMGPGGIGRGLAGDPVVANARQVCEAILADDPARWETIRGRYFAGNGAAPGLFKVAKAQSVYFPRGSRVRTLRRSADGMAGDRRMVAVECRTETPAGDRLLTLHWEREKNGPWHLTDHLSASATSETPSGKGLPAAASTAADRKSKPHPQAH
jgi:hypothetical protein